MAADLTPQNFVTKIKEMEVRDRKKIRCEELINIILQLPGDFVDSYPTKFEEKLNELSASIDFVKLQAVSNTTELLSLKSMNSNLETENNTLKNEIMKINIDMKVLSKDSQDHEEHFNAIERYLRINNVEVVGLPEPEEDNENEVAI